MVNIYIHCRPTLLTFHQLECDWRAQGEEKRRLEGGRKSTISRWSAMAWILLQIHLLHSSQSEGEDGVRDLRAFFVVGHNLHHVPLFLLGPHSKTSLHQKPRGWSSCCDKSQS